jgi:hypothetical protein
MWICFDFFKALALLFGVGRGGRGGEAVSADYYPGRKSRICQPVHSNFEVLLPDPGEEHVDN